MEMIYDVPAGEWSEALPLGNGNLGAMVFGGVREERICLNDDTLWSGTPGTAHDPAIAENLPGVRDLIRWREYEQAQKRIEESMLGPWNQSYMPLGDITLSLSGPDDAGSGEGYRRSLDLRKALWQMETGTRGTGQSRECWVSRPDGILVYTVRQAGGSLDLSAGVSSLLASFCGQDRETLILSGQAPSHVVPNYVEHGNPVQYNGQGMAFSFGVRILHDGTSLPGSDGRIHITGATEAVLIAASATGYRNCRSVVTDPSVTEQEVRNRLARLSRQDIPGVRERHLKDYGRLFGTCGLRLGNGSGRREPKNVEALLKSRIPEDERTLTELFFQYGRYLLISSSRPGSQPANLQGIWSSRLRPDWSSNWTVNINTQMNYWPAETTGLAECHAPLFDMIRELSRDGGETAAANYGCQGWTAHHNVDLWKTGVPVGGNAQWAFWPMGGPWLCQHLWTHYRFTQDKSFLRETALPLLKGAALFILDFLVREEEGYMTLPSTSPENNFLTPRGRAAAVGRGSALDLTLCREVLENTLGALSETDQRAGHEALIESIETVLADLCSVRVSSRGVPAEWYDESAYADPGHRHFSPLYGLYPGDTFFRSPDRTALLAGAQKLLEERLSNSSALYGWSCAWAISLRARLKDGEGAGRALNTLLYDSLNSVLLSEHPPLDGNAPPFQIDGDFGGTAGIVEMLLQSHDGCIELLPALPENWSCGEFRGFGARGGFSVSLEWRDRRPVRMTLFSAAGGECSLRIPDRAVLSLEGGGAVKVRRDGNGIIRTNPGETCIITFDYRD